MPLDMVSSQLRRGHATFVLLKRMLPRPSHGACANEFHSETESWLRQVRRNPPVTRAKSVTQKLKTVAINRAQIQLVTRCGLHL